MMKNASSLSRYFVLTLSILQQRSLASLSGTPGSIDSTETAIVNPSPNCDSAGSSSTQVITSKLDPQNTKEETLKETLNTTKGKPEFSTDDPLRTTSGVISANKKEKSVSDSNGVSGNVAKQDQCNLYLAKSSIPNAGIGIYTSVDYKKGDYVGEGEMLITVTDFDREQDWLPDDVVWGVGLDDRLYYESLEDNKVYYPGFGAQINCHFHLNNMEHDKPKFDSAGLHRDKDPGAGSFTYWHDMPNIAERDIQAGEELFVSYGESWFELRKEYIGAVPFENDFKTANEIVRKFQQTLNVDLSEGDSVEARSKAWDMVIKHEMRDGVRMILPDRYEDLEEAHKIGVARHSLGGKDSIRTPEWFDVHGMCIDNIYVKTSEIPQAGRGAFAKRFMEEGSLISPSPVLQTNITHFTIPRNESEKEDQSNKSNSKQLLTNYALGHPDSDIFLLPYNSLVNFINHDSKDPNAKLRWSDSSLHRKDFLELGSEELLNAQFGLLMEIVALRDILPDEEVLIDYGKEWEEAWLHHTEQWTPPKGSEDYASAEELIAQELPILTEDEQELTPYPSNVQTACFFWHTATTSYEQQEVTIEDKGNFTRYRTEWQEKNNYCLRYCKILDRFSYDDDNTTVLYNVELLPQTENIHEDCIHPDNELVFVDNVPSKAVTFTDRAFSRDQHLNNAFRHHIGLPDELFPTKWSRNKQESVAGSIPTI